MDLHIHSDEAETILFALALRAKQSKLSPHQANEALELGRSLDKQFAEWFGWDKTIDRMKLNTRPIKRVTITFYDYPPKDGEL